jgi:hypothetical protein
MSISTQIQESSPPDPPLNFIHGCSLPIAHQQLITQLGEDFVRENFFLGRLYGPNDEIIDHWTTFKGKRALIIRGSDDVSHRVCTVCGRHVYFATGMQYLYPAPQLGVEVFESHLFGLVLTAPVFERLDLSIWRHLSVEELPVLKKPRDSLGVFA